MRFDDQGWLDVATGIDYSANSMSRQGYSIKYLVLHGTAGGTSAQSIGQYFQSTAGGSNPVSSHLIIDQQGNVVQGVPMSLAAFGNGVITNGHASYLPDPSINPNWYTASIEFVKASTDNSDPLTAIQTQVGFEVIQCICDTYNIPKRAGDANGGVISHADIDPINRARCPGTLDWNALWQYLNNGANNNMIVPKGWTDDSVNKILKAPNGIPVVLGFRDFILNATNNWNADNFPLEAEHAANPVEQSNPSLGGGTSQTFRMCRLCYTAQRGVYVSWIGQELQWYQQQNNSLQSQITALKAQPAMANLKQINAYAQNIVGLSTVQ